MSDRTAGEQTVLAQQGSESAENLLPDVLDYELFDDDEFLTQSLNTTLGTALEKKSDASFFICASFSMYD